MTKPNNILYENDSAFDLYLGERRSGKDLSMVADTEEIILKYPKTKIFTNFWLNPDKFKNVELLDNEKLLNMFKDNTQFFNSIFLISEAHILFDSRNFMRKANKFFGYFIGQVSKRGNIVKMNTHRPELIDIRLREYADRKIYCYKGIVINNIFYQLEDYNKSVDNNIMYIKRECFRIKLVGYEFVSYPDKDYKVYVKASNHFDSYDSFEILQKEEEEKE